MWRLIGGLTRRGCGCVLLALVVVVCAACALYGAVQLAERLLNAAPH